jgi:predicted phosphodiesterase
VFEHAAHDIVSLMRVAALYDIHGNLPALEAVLAEPDVIAADVVLVGGDALAGPMPAATLRLLTGLGGRVTWISGNNEREMFEQRGGDQDAGEPWDRRAAWISTQLDAAELDAVAAWPATAVLDIDGLGPVCFCHASPRNDHEIFTAISPPERVEPMLAATPEATVVCGHTHVQFDRVIGRHRVVNAGSVGMPYEDLPGARWCLLGPDVELRRTEYDLAAAAEAIRATDVPDPDELAGVVEHQPGAEEATRFFEEAAARQE